MMHRYLAIGLIAATTTVNAQVVTIVESRTYDLDHTMDTLWQWVATDMGLDATIVEQDMLDGSAGLAGTDVLIISSGLIELSEQRAQTIRAFVESGRPVYLQSEYLASFSTNILFDELVSDLGGSFTWETELQYDLGPVPVSGELGLFPNSVETLDYCWYGVSGSGTHVEAFLNHTDGDLGWIFRDPGGLNGMVVTTTDQDWVRSATSPALVENILYLLVQDIITDVAGPTAPLIGCLPNPTTGTAVLTWPGGGRAELLLHDATGRTMLHEQRMSGDILDLSTRPAGIYTCTVRTPEHVLVQRLVKE